MNSLWILLSSFLIIALLFVILPLSRKIKVFMIDRQKTNTQIYQERVDLLQAEALDDQSLAENEQQFAQQLLSDLQQDTPIALSTVKLKQRLIPALLISLFIIIFSSFFYMQWGASTALKQYLTNQQTPIDITQWGTPEQIAERLKNMLEQTPEDAQGWFLLGRLYLGLQEFSKAEQALAKANHLQANNPKFMLQYAQAIYLANKNRLTPQAEQLLESVLTLEPDNIEAENLLALNLFSQQQYQAAIDKWRRIVVTLPPDHPDAKAILAAIAQAQTLLAEQAQLATLPHLRIDVTVEPALLTKVNAEDTVFIVARANNMPLPLAALKKSAAQLPFTVSLSDLNAMTPQAKLTDVRDVKIIVRISQSEQPLAQAGDLQGEISIDNWQQQTAPLRVIIDHVVEKSP